MYAAYLLHSNVASHDNFSNSLPILGNIDELLSTFIIVFGLIDYTYGIRGEEAESLASRKACSIL